MADYGSLQSPKNSYQHPFFSTPRLFTGFVSKPSNDIEPIMSSPTSILETKPFSALKNPFYSDPSTPKTPKLESKNLWEKFDEKRVSLGLLDALIDEKSNPVSSRMDSPKVVFGSQLRIQVPPLPFPVLSPNNESPKSPGDFGIKTRNAHVGSFSPRLCPSPLKRSPFGSLGSGAFSGVSVSEMEMSEDYTCVISYGPNAKTTHIFDDCVVESCCGVVKCLESRKECGMFLDQPMSYPSDSFLSFCYNCRKNLGQGKDIYMYRGEKAFCSSDCRYKEMTQEEESDDLYSTS